MHHVKSEPRNQMQIFCLDQMVDPNSFVRIIDFFVDTIDLKSFGFKHVTLKKKVVHPFTLPCYSNYTSTDTVLVCVRHAN